MNISMWMSLRLRYALQMAHTSGRVKSQHSFLSHSRAHADPHPLGQPSTTFSEIPHISHIGRDVNWMIEGVHFRKFQDIALGRSSMAMENPPDMEVYTRDFPASYV